MSTPDQRNREFSEQENEAWMPEDDVSELVFEDIPMSEEDEELAEALDDAITEAEYAEYQQQTSQLTKKFTQQELIRLKDDFDSEDEKIRQMTRDIVYNNYKGLVHFVMTRYYGTYISSHHDDLIQQGNIGVMTGFRDYQPDRNGQFFQPSTIITRHIRHEMREYIAKSVGGTTTKYHSTGQKMIEIIRRKKNAGEEVEPEDIANELGISLTTAKHSLKAITINTQMASLDDKVQDGETSIMDLTPANIETPEEAALKHEFQDNIKYALDTALNDIQRDVIILRYGLRDDNDYSLNAIAEMLNIPVENVRGILSSATTRLRQFMNSSSMFAGEHKERTQRAYTTNQRTPDELKREIDSYDFSSLDDFEL